MITKQSSRKAKILIIVQNLSVPFDRRVWRECQALREAGYAISVICPKGAAHDQLAYEKIEEISIYRYPMYQSKGGFLSYLIEYAVALVMTTWLLLRVYRRHGFEVIQICNPPDLLILPVLPFKLLGKKFVFDQHDLCPEIYQAQRPHVAGDSWVLKALFLFERMTYRFSDVVMVVNESCRKIALTRGRKPDRDVFVVRNGPSISNIRGTQPNIDLKQEKNYLLVYVGMMGPQEGIDIMLRAIKHLCLRDRLEDFHVRIIGGGTVLDEMKRYAEELGITHLVTFTGHLDHKRVMESIASADVCLCPDPKTPLNDKCSMAKAIEYMSLGRPFVCFDLEEVRNCAGDAALYAVPNEEIDFAEKIHILLEDAQMRSDLGAIGRERVLRFLAWDHSKPALLTAYERVLGVEQAGHLEKDPI